MGLIEESNLVEETPIWLMWPNVPKEMTVMINIMPNTWKKLELTDVELNEMTA